MNQPHLFPDESIRLTRDERKAEIIALLDQNANFDMTVRQIARFLALRKSRYLADLLDEMADEGILRKNEYKYNQTQVVKGYGRVRGNR